VDHIYELPMKLNREGADERVCEKLGIWAAAANLDPWRDLMSKIRQPAETVSIAIVGKYVHLTDTYKSLNEALYHGGIANRTKVEIRFIDSEHFDIKNSEKELEGVDGVLVPGGFGVRGVEGKIAAIRYARTHDVPYFGICLGMQLAVLEYARTVLEMRGAMSREFEDNPTHPVVELMDEQRNVVDKGGTMRLGAYPCRLSEGSRSRQIYGDEEISERHRHRYEVNPKYHQQLIDGGMQIVGWSPDRILAEMVELPDHPWFIGCQFHPEFKSRPLDPHPLFSSYIKACVTHKQLTLRQKEAAREATAKSVQPTDVKDAPSA
jgi:CTP synthase